MSRGARIAQIALAHVGCSEDKDVDRYNDVIVRPVDRTPALIGYYDRNPRLSTCSLFAVGCLRLAGIQEPETVGTYFPGGSMRNSMVDLQTLAARHSAWITGSAPVPPPKQGDCIIVADDHGMDAHAIVCVADAVVGSSPDVNAPGATWVLQTVEGGQLAPGGSSSAIEAFTRTFRCVANRWMLGSRYLLGYVRAEALPIPDDGDPLPANPVQTDTKDVA